MDYDKIAILFPKIELIFNNKFKLILIKFI